MQKLNIELSNNSDFEKSKKLTYDKIRNHPILKNWLEKYPKSEKEVLDNIFKLEKMIHNEEEASLITSQVMTKDLYYETLDESFDFYYKKYDFIVQEENQYPHLNGYLFQDIPTDFLKADVSKLAQSEDVEYQETMQQILNAFKNNKGAYLYGEMGVGKTYLIHAFLNYFINEYQLICASVRSNDMIRQFSLRSKNADEYMDYFYQMTTVPVLLIDDIGSETVEDFGRDTVLFSVLDERMKNNRLTYFTSNLDLENLELHFKADKYGREFEHKAQRIIERIKTLCTPVLMKGVNRRY